MTLNAYNLISITGLILIIIGVLLSKGTFKEGVIIAFGVLPKGDTELIIASLALQSGIINTVIFSAIVITALTTTLIAPVLFKIAVKRAG